MKNIDGYYKTNHHLVFCGGFQLNRGKEAAPPTVPGCLNSYFARVRKTCVGQVRSLIMQTFKRAWRSRSCWEKQIVGNSFYFRVQKIRKQSLVVVQAIGFSVSENNKV